jgi:rhamnose utilization protein RhaD (predicted bifunctional aldolase and dehydrogenase)
MDNNLTSLKEVSTRVGAEISLVQGGGGNASVKIDDILYIKASGAWLKDALKKNIFVPLCLSSAYENVKKDLEDYMSLVIPNKLGSELRPSIETGMHAAMPYKFVFHVHPVNTIVSSIVENFRGQLEQKLEGINWAILPYIQPGPQLGKAICNEVSNTSPQVIILSNHGLIVGANTAENAYALIKDVESRLKIPIKSLAPTIYEKAQKEPIDGYIWLDNLIATTIACNSEMAKILTHGALVPDQVVYLGGPAVLIERFDELSNIFAHWKQKRNILPGLIFVSGKGAIVRSDLSAGGISMISLLCEIALRVPNNSDLQTLSLQEELILLNWDAEKFRQSVDANR